eukprot:tig00000792_g4215.t1
MVPAPLIPSAEPIFRKLVDRKLLRPEIQQIDQLRFWQCWRGATVRLYHDEFAVVVEGGPVTLIVAPAKVVQPDLAHYGLGLPPAGPAAPAALAAVAPRAPTAASSAGSAAGSGDEDDGLEQYERFLSLDTDGIFGGISADQAKDQIFGKGARANIKNLNRFLAAPFRLHYGEADGLSKVRGQNTLVIADMEDALAVLLDRTVETSSIPAKIKEKCTERMKQRLQTLNPYEKTRALLEVNRIYRTWTMIMSVDNIPFLPKPDVEPPWETNLATVKEKAARSGITHQSRVHAAKRRDDENSDGGGGAATEHPKKATKKAPAEKKAATEKTNRARKHEEAEDENAAEAAVTGARLGTARAHLGTTRARPQSSGTAGARNGAPRAEKSATGGQNAEDSVKKKKKKKRTPAPKDTEEELETEIEPQLSKKPRAASVKEHTSASSSSKAASGPEKKAAKGKDPEHSGKAQEQSSHRGPKHAPSRDDEASTQAPPESQFKYFLCIRETVKSKSTYKQGHIFPKCNKHGDPPSGCLGVYGIKQLIQDTAKLAAAQKKAAAAK